MGDPNDDSTSAERDDNLEDRDGDESHEDEMSKESFPSSDPPSSWSSAGTSDT